MSGCGPDDDLLLSLGIGHQTSGLWRSRYGFLLYGIPRPAILAGPLWLDKLSRRPPVVRDPLAARPTLCAGLCALLVSHRRGPTSPLQHLAGGRNLGGIFGRRRRSLGQGPFAGFNS